MVDIVHIIYIYYSKIVKPSTSKAEEIVDNTIEVQTENTITKEQFQVLVDNIVIIQQSLITLI